LHATALLRHLQGLLEHRFSNNLPENDFDFCGFSVPKSVLRNFEQQVAEYVGK